MRSLINAFRAMFKPGRNTVIKIVSLSCGLAIGLLLLSKISFENSYDTYFPDWQNIYAVQGVYTIGSDAPMTGTYISGAIAPGIKEEAPMVSQATRIAYLTAENEDFITTDKKRYHAGFILADTSYFDIFPQKIILGDIRSTMKTNMHAAVSESIARAIGMDKVIGTKLRIESMPKREIEIGAVFKDQPQNTTHRFDIAVSMESADKFIREGTAQNWLGNERYFGFVKLEKGFTAKDVEPYIDSMIQTKMPMEEVEQAGFSIRFNLLPLAQAHASTFKDSSELLLIMGIVAFALIFTASINYILIVISSLVNRSRDMAVHKCYGAGYRDIFRMMMSESLLHIIAALIVAGVIVVICRQIVVDLLGVDLTGLISQRSVIMIATVCLVVFIITSIIPGQLFARTPIACAFKNYRRSRRFWRLGLLFAQIVASTFILTLLLFISLQYNKVINDNPGYDYENVFYCNVSGSDSISRVNAVDELRKLPQIKNVSTNFELYFAGSSGNNVTLPDDNGHPFNVADLYYSTNEMLEIFKIKIIQGRGFNQKLKDSEEVLVSSDFVERMNNIYGWGNDIIGRQIIVSEHCDNREPVTICGVYERFRLGLINNLDDRPSIMFYREFPSHNIFIRFADDDTQDLSLVQDKLDSLFPDREVYLKSYKLEMVSRYNDSRKFRDLMMIGAIVTLLITIAGLVGYSNDEANRRRKEMAVRMINGATRSDILYSFSKDIFRMTIPAILIGLTFSSLATLKWLEQFSERITLNPLLLAGAGMIILLIVGSVVIFSIWRKMQINPADNLKSE